MVFVVMANIFNALTKLFDQRPAQPANPPVIQIILPIVADKVFVGIKGFSLINIGNGDVVFLPRQVQRYIAVLRCSAMCKRVGDQLLDNQRQSFFMIRFNTFLRAPIDDIGRSQVDGVMVCGKANCDQFESRISSLIGR